MPDSPTPTPTPQPQTPATPTPVQPPSTPPTRPEPTPHDPSVEPHPTRSSTPIKIALIVLFALLLGAAAFLLVWPRLLSSPSTPPTNSTSTTGENGTPPLGETPPTNSTSTSSTTTQPTTPTAPPTDERDTIERGSTDIWFAGDEKLIRDPKTGHYWSIRAIEFGDSRCPANVVCVWAGERTVTLEIRDAATGRTERVILGTSRGRTVTANGLTLNLVTIDDGKGGVYAEIKVD